MKKLICIITLLIPCLLIPVIALAAGEGGATLQEMFDWATLLTTSGATAAVLLIVQYIKVPMDNVFHIPTRVFVLALSFIVMLGAKAFTTGVVLADVPLLILNAFVVALAAMGAYEATFAKNENQGIEVDEHGEIE